MRLLWKSARLGVIILSVLIFTPIVIPANEFRPQFMGLPYTLWAGILVYFGYVFLILLGIRAHSRIFKERERHD
jgi:hypothetical protein